MRYYRRARTERGGASKIARFGPQDLFDLTAIEDDLRGFEACFYCLGPSSSGMSEQDYERVTFGMTTVVAETLARLNPNMTFI